MLQDDPPFFSTIRRNVKELFEFYPYKSILDSLVNTLRDN